MTPDEAFQLVTTLQQRRFAGEDDVALITYLCNRFRISKNEARSIYDSFYRGFQHGADQIMGVASKQESPPGDDVVFSAASRMSTQITQDIIEKKHLAASGCRGVSLLVLLGVWMVLLIFST